MHVCGELIGRAVDSITERTMSVSPIDQHPPQCNTVLFQGLPFGPGEEGEVHPDPKYDTYVSIMTARKACK